MKIRYNAHPDFTDLKVDFDNVKDVVIVG